MSRTAAAAESHGEEGNMSIASHKWDDVYRETRTRRSDTAADTHKPSEPPRHAYRMHRRGSLVRCVMSLREVARSAMPNGLI
jgi:hypothetical protein